MKIVIPVKDYAAIKGIQNQAVYQKIKEKKIQTEPVYVRRKEIGVIVETTDLSPQELEKLKELLGNL